MKSGSACAIILAGGVGSRMKSEVTKQKMLISGISILRRCVSAFDKCDDIDEIIVVAREDELDFAVNETENLTKRVRVVAGGATRYESAVCGFRAVGDKIEYVAIHDAARPLITPEMICDVLRVAKEKGSATAAAKVTDTVKVIDIEGKIVSTPNRDALVRATTPQIFRKDIYERAVNRYSGDANHITDDNMLVEMLGEPVYTVVSDVPNPKITTPEDIYYAELLIKGEENV